MKKRSAITSVICAAALITNMFGAAAIPAAAAESTDSVTTFTFSNDGISVSNAKDKNYKIDGTELTINGEGSYKVTGSCTDGNIKVKKSVKGVTLTLSDLTLTSQTTAPLTCNKNSQADIIVEGTVTFMDTVKNSEDYWYDQGLTDSDSEVDAAENAVVKFKGASKVTVSGDGTLNILANAKNGIKSGATLDSELSEELAADPESEYYSHLTMSGLTVNIDATNVYIPESDSDSASTPMQGFREDTTETYGDGINAESCLNIESGVYNIRAGDDGMHCDYEMNVGVKGAPNSALDINIENAYEGIEAANLNFYSGDIEIATTDDSINAANGDLSNYQFELNIYGGDIYANGSGDDAVDSNGRINVYGGKIIAIAGERGNAFDTGTDGNNRIDASFNIYGGEVFGIGQSNMSVAPSSVSQSWVSWSGSGNGGFNPVNPGEGGDTDGRPEMPGEWSSDTDGRPARPGEWDNTSTSDIPFPFGQSDSDFDFFNLISDIFNPGQNTDSSDIDKGSVDNPSGARGGNFFDQRNNQGNTTSTNMTDSSSITLTSGATTGIAVGQSPNVTANTKIAVVLNNETELISAIAPRSANYVIYSGKMTADEDTDSSSAADTSEDTNTEDNKSTDTSEDAATDTSTDNAADTESDAPAVGYTGTFVIEGGSASITTYATQDYTKGEENQESAVARNSSTGEIDVSGSGQINFTVIPADGFKVASVTATDGAYKNIKDSKDTNLENTYRITKITDDLTITITLEKAVQDTDTADDTATDTDSDTDNTTGKLLFGDVTKDNVIRSDDALSILRYSLKMEDLNEFQLFLADVNKDGAVNSADALLVLRKSVGLTDDGSFAGQYVEIIAE